MERFILKKMKARKNSHYCKPLSLKGVQSLEKKNFKNTAEDAYTG